ncbi:redoxin domain-containing protein [Aestuariibaculum sp. M13]|uniref:redoxin domain-containing protein n=1 Tax=Aestuariibaculum sp. M13 TaxID=2967132 RepID=UPI002159CA83|nr:redoxin domain-containing protein [Aestuariibaculum sp. M13]MCR8668923.1 redoxin domain-containing protein [Aestuariibaculum sp. M13]
MKKTYMALGFSAILLVGCGSANKASNITQEQLNQMDSSGASKIIKKLLKSKVEEDYKKVVNYYNAQKNKEKSKEIVDLAAEEFPYGFYAARVKTSEILREEDPVDKIKLFEEAKMGFQSQNFEGAYYTMIKFQLDRGNYKEAVVYQQEMDERSQMRFLALDLISREVNKSEKNFGLVDLLESELSKFEANKGKSDNQLWLKDSQLLKTLKFSYAEALYKEGKLDEAIKVIQVLRNTSENKGKLSLKYATMLAKCGSYEEALPALENAVIEGKATEETKTYLKTAYTELGNTDYDTYLDGLMNKMNDEILNHLAEIMINEPSPNFTLKDINGKDVTNEDLKGKTLVVDFWATWCGPCKASFPGMKAAANKYKNDEDVMFLFVHTFEKDKDPLTLAKNYLSENNYDFDLYMDYRNAETRTNQAASAFGVTGIPTKVVIDPKGNLRFKVVGFKGGIDGMVAELSAMIEMAQGKDLKS